MQISLTLVFVNSLLVWPGVAEQLSDPDLSLVADGALTDLYDLQTFSWPLTVSLTDPKHAKFKLSLFHKISCGGTVAHGCISVPGNPEESIGVVSSIDPAVKHRPAEGVKVVLADGDVCQAIPNKRRTTEITLKCPSDLTVRPNPVSPARLVDRVLGRERPHPFLCEYKVEIITPAACPTINGNTITVSAVSGCSGSIYQPQSTFNCSAVGGSLLLIHGVGLSLLPRHLHVLIGEVAECQARIVSDWLMECRVRVNVGNKLEAQANYRLKVEAEGLSQDLIVEVQAGITVSFNHQPDFQHLFTHLSSFGIAGMTEQAKELYDKVFMPRTLPAHILADLGLTPVKGVILHGPPGTGKSLLARSIASVFAPHSVRMVSAPELLNKYIGESELNLRSLFTKSEQDWFDSHVDSPLHIVIMDEIDAICKPRGREASNIGSLVYDSLVNQLLTVLDGPRQQSNIIVIGLTNRFELLDRALLRPGRFEVHIEMTLPSLAERLEILELKLQSAKDTNRLADNIDFYRLASLTEGLTPADLDGMVRKSQISALHSAVQSNNVHNVQITMSDLLSSLPSHAIRRDERLQTENCTHISALYQAINSTNKGGLPAASNLQTNTAALILTDDYRTISACMMKLFTDSGYHVAIYDTGSYLSDPSILSNIHNIPSSINAEKIVIILNDLCYMLMDCTATDDMKTNLNSIYTSTFLTSLRNLIRVETWKRTALIATCPSTCFSSHIAKHFTLQFKMTSVTDAPW